MSKSEDISVIILNWNTKDLLLECLNSLKECGSKYRREIIVVDNASIDDSVQSVKKQFPYVKVIQNKENLGFAKGNNIGIKESSGRYVCLINSDVRILPGCIDKLTSRMDQDTSIGIIGPKILWPDMTLQDSCRTFPSLWNSLSPALGMDKIFRNSPFFSGEHMFHFKHDVVFPADYLAGCFFMVRRKALEEVGLLDERFFIYQEEVDWCKRFKSSGWDVVFFPEATIIHNHGASSSKDPLRFATEQIKSKIKYWKKHHGRLAVMTFLLIILVHHGIRLVSDGILYIIVPSKKAQIIQRLSKNYFSLKYVLLRR